MKLHTITLTDEQIDKYGLRELVPFTGWTKIDEIHDTNKNWLGYYENNILKYGIDNYFKWFIPEDLCLINIGLKKRPATHEEIETGLIEMSNNLGFKDGVRFNTIETDIAICSKNAIVDKSGIFYFDNCIYTTNGVIYLQGKWATIIEQHKEMTIEEIQKELGYKIKIVE